MGAVNKTEDDGQSLPKSIRHKRILDIAAERPDASVEAIAEDVPSATVNLVERVIEEYGDPASKNDDEQTAEAAEKAKPEDANVSNDRGDDDPFEERTPDADEEHSVPSPSDLTDTQNEVLRAIYNCPESTQREIGDMLDISASTVCNHVNSIDGFEWEDRQAIVKTRFDSDRPQTPEKTPRMSSSNPDATTSRDDLTERVSAIEQQVNELTRKADTDSMLDDTELMHKVLHACLESDVVTEEEELQLLEGLLQ